MLKGSAQVHRWQLLVKTDQESDGTQAVSAPRPLLPGHLLCSPLVGLLEQTVDTENLVLFCSLFP